MTETTSDIDELRAEIAGLKARIGALEAERENSGGEGENGTEAGRWGDHRDHAVLDTLRPGQPYSAGQLKTIYRKETDIAAEPTLKARMKALVESDFFEPTKRHGHWWFLGEDDE